jgi:hypothetical protein
MRTRRTMNSELPMKEIRCRLSWVEFLDPLSEEKLGILLRGARFVRLRKGEVMVLGPEEHAERMLVVVAGQLQVFEVHSASEHELTLLLQCAEGPRE